MHTSFGLAIKSATYSTYHSIEVPRGRTRNCSCRGGSFLCHRARRRGVRGQHSRPSRRKGHAGAERVSFWGRRPHAETSLISVDAPPIDRAYLTVDDTDGTFKNHVYAHAYRYSRNPLANVLFFAATNEGRSFENMLVNGATTFEKPWFLPANGVVGNDGTSFALIAELDDTKRNMSYRTDAASAPSAANAVLLHPDQFPDR